MVVNKKIEKSRFKEHLEGLGWNNETFNLIKVIKNKISVCFLPFSIKYLFRT